MPGARKIRKGFSVLQYVVIIVAITIAVMALRKLAQRALQEKFRESADNFSGGKLWVTPGGEDSGNFGNWLPPANEPWGNWDYEDDTGNPDPGNGNSGNDAL